jgi:transposase
VRRCGGCGSSLRGSAAQDYDRRQVFELPEIRVKVTEHRAEKKLCGCCGQLSCAEFPEGVTQKAQYGSRLQAYAVYIRNYGLLSYERAAQLFEDLFSVPLSPGTLVNMDRGCGRRLEDATQLIRQGIIESAVSGFDETGISINGTLHWLHTASTEELTYLGCHAKRGKEAFEAIGILPAFTGRAVHDHWSSYFTYECQHALCNAHHLRELTFVFEEYAQRWAKTMIDLLLEIKQAVQKALQRGQRRFNRPTCSGYEKRYRAILAAGLRANPPPADVGGQAKRGRPKQSKARNLVLRLKSRRCETLAFMYDFAVPFTNNHAERDLRISKVQQKISGTFRSADSAVFFCRIRSYIATMKKNGIRVIEALHSVLLGTPILPPCLRNG